jgi:maltokinase
MIPDDIRSLLVERLPEHLARQRWSGAHDRAITGLQVKWLDVVREGDPALVWTVVTAQFAEGDEQDYQLFIGMRAAEAAPEFLQGKERELVALLTGEPGGLVVYDALVDPELAIDVLHLVAPEIEVEVRRPLVLEHSNSSVVYDEAHILKIFRRVEPGPNPDVEITRVLADRGYVQVLPPKAELRRDGVDLAVLRDFLVGATEGWELARASVRDLLAGGLPPEESGADFAPDAERLGTILAGLHRCMGEAWGAAAGDVGRWAAEMEAGLREVQAAAGGALPDRFDAGAISARYAELAGMSDVGQEIRIHGDLHLAQVIKADAGWKFLDFEGEPARRRDDRFTTSSPLRDVAGFLRSLHYVAATGLAEWATDQDDLAELVTRWEKRNRAALLDSYYAAEGIEQLLPTTEAGRRIVLSAFELDKAVYEVGYELGHRPDSVTIPLAGIDRLLRPETGP